MSKLHPLIQRIAEEGSSIITALRELAPGGESPLPAMLQLRKSLEAPADREAALEAARAADAGPVDLNVKVLFYVIWSLIARMAGRIAEAEALSSRCRLLAEESGCHPALRVHAVMSQMHVLESIGRFDECEKLFLWGLENTPGDDARLFHDYSTLLAIRGRGVLAIEERERLKNAEAISEGEAYFRMLHCAETGRYELAFSFFKKAQDIKSVSVSEDGLADYGDILRGLVGEDTSALKLPGRAISALMAGEAREALELARKHVAERADFLYEANMGSLNLVRAELSCGNAEAGRRIIRLRRSRGNTRYLDDFFLARACMIEGDEDRAAGHFAQATEACARFDALPRLELEIRLACELAPVAVARMARAVFESSGETKRKVFPETGSEALSADSSVSGIHRLIGNSTHLQEVRKAIRGLAAGKIPVLVIGETGTGKELVARALHEESASCKETFLAVNCAAISDSLLESELFGYARGAFTGAEKSHAGIFETAGKGTVFLDEIGDISPRLQVALLRFLESGEYRPVGSNRTSRAECRVVAATNADLVKRIEEGSFRRDLFYRLRGATIEILPLRERSEDVPVLAEYFLSTGRSDSRRPQLSEALRRELTQREWPGNIRQLRNEIELMRLMNSDKSYYDIQDLSHRESSSSEAAVAEKPGTGTEESSGRLQQQSSSPLRRKEKLLELFREHRRLTRVEVAAALEFSPDTATRYLKRLIAEGEIKKVTPSGAPRSHYFEIQSGE